MYDDNVGTKDGGGQNIGFEDTSNVGIKDDSANFRGPQGSPAETYLQQSQGLAKIKPGDRSKSKFANQSQGNVKFDLREVPKSSPEQGPTNEDDFPRNMTSMFNTEAMAKSMPGHCNELF